MTAVRGRRRCMKSQRDNPPSLPVSNYLVTFLRMITSAQIRGNPNDFEPFLMHPDTGEKMGSKEFCESLVEVLGKEAGEQSVPFSLLLNLD